MKRERGAALILTVIMLALLMALGAALLSSVALEVAIGENYRTETQLLYLAETGVVEARGVLRTASSTPSEMLMAAAGVDRILSVSRDLDTLLNASDDVPLIHGGNRTSGKILADTSGQPAGRYFVYIRNDSAEGISSLVDSNRILTLLSVGVLGNSRKVLEATMMKWRFPAIPSSLVLDGTPVTFIPNSSSEISGQDLSGGNGGRFGIGVLTEQDAVAVGSGDVHVVDSVLDPRLRTPSMIERLIQTVLESSTDTWNPGPAGLTTLGNVGNAADNRIVVVNGDCELNSGSGFGTLLVRGNLWMKGSYMWNGLILVIGQGSVSWSGPGAMQISGEMFVARTRANDRGPSNELGTVLASRGPVVLDLSLAGTQFQLTNPGNSAIVEAQQKFQYVSIAFREY